MAEESDAILREIDDELREEQWAKLWKAYGRYVVAAAVAIVVGVAGYKGWQAYDLKTRTEQGERFAAAQSLALGGRTEDALGAFGRLSQDAGAGYSMLARFREAALLQGADAVAAYTTLADDTGLPATYRDLAVILGALQESNLPSGGEGKLISRAAGLNVSGNPWRHSAQEIMAIDALRQGQKTKARDIYAALAKDAAAPQGLRQRANEMLLALGQ